MPGGPQWLEAPVRPCLPSAWRRYLPPTREGPPVRRFPFRRGFGFGHLFGLIFLIRHPIFLAVIAVVVVAIYLYRKRR